MSDHRNSRDNCNCDLGSWSLCASCGSHSEPQNEDFSCRESRNWESIWELDPEAYLLNILDGSSPDLPLPPRFDGLDQNNPNDDENPMGQMIDSIELVAHLPVVQDSSIGNSEQARGDNLPWVPADGDHEVESPAPDSFLQQGVHHNQTNEPGLSNHDFNIDRRIFCEPSIGQFRQDAALPNNQPRVDMDMDAIFNPHLGLSPEITSLIQQRHLKTTATNGENGLVGNPDGRSFGLPAQQAGSESHPIAQADVQPASAAMLTPVLQDQGNLNLNFHLPYALERPVCNPTPMPYQFSDPFSNFPPLQSLSEHGSLLSGSNMPCGSVSQSFLDPFASIPAPAAPAALRGAPLRVFVSFQPWISREQQQGQDEQEEVDAAQPANQHPPRGMGKRGQRNSTLHAHGLCIWCRKPNPDLKKKGCPDCLPLRAASTAKWRRKRAGNWDDREDEMEGGESR